MIVLFNRMVRPMDRSGFDRPTSWGNPMARPDNRPRPSSSPATRHFDDKTPFLAHPGHIGRHFDEDERKPLDGVSAPRKTVGDEGFHVEVHPESASSGRISNWGGSSSFSQASSGPVNSYAGRAAEQSQIGVNSQNSVGNSGQMGSGSYPNAWTARRDMAASVSEPVQSGWNGQSAVSKLVHASALEKVSSGRWQSKHSVQYHADVQVIQPPETANGLRPKSDDNVYDGTDAMGGREFSDASLARHVERGLNIEDGFQGGRKEEHNHESTNSSTLLEVKERKPTYYAGSVQPAYSNGKFCGPESQPLVHSEASERPKLKLFPRTKPLENSEPDGPNPNEVLL